MDDVQLSGAPHPLAKPGYGKIACRPEAPRKPVFTPALTPAEVRAHPTRIREGNRR
ncbi:hypothetical protein [Streptomyces sp. NPDC051183]|uniref:hypothetical protein n=1 Tax=Streptomyces sp. NPDC051183 TaxID=3155165 RepID=UPI0034194016